MGCTRRDISRWSVCRCVTCRRSNAKMAKLARCGALPPVRSVEAWAVIDRLTADGWSPGAIASGAGVQLATMRGAFRARRINGHHTWTAAYADRILAIQEPGGGHVSGAGTRRRLQALAAAGWSIYAIRAVMADPPPASTLYTIRMRATDTPIRAVLHLAVRNTYTALNERTAPVGSGADQARAKAAKGGWPPAACWDEETIDNPDPSLDLAAHDAMRGDETAEQARAGVVASVIELYEQGERTDRIATRVGLSERQVQRHVRDTASARGGLNAAVGPARCGTDGGYYRHTRTLGEPACVACRGAHARAELDRKERVTAEGSAA